MSTLHRGPSSGEPWWARGGRWPWWALLAAIVGAVLVYPSLRSGTPAANSGKAANSAPTQQRVVQAAAGGNAQAAPAASGAALPAGVTLPEGWTMTQWGPLGPAERELIVKVRQAGLWEGPSGELAQTHTKTARVKEVGAQLTTDHRGLDEQVRSVAAKLGVPLPDQASAEQQGWVAELTGKQGDDFDKTFSDRLRAAHGKVFLLIGQVRTGTRNDLVRSFAQTAVNIVMKHMTLLESIGKVDYGALPTPAASPVASKPVDSVPTYNEAIWLAAALALAGAGTAGYRAFRARRPRRF